jgi:hypothetical protein
MGTESFLLKLHYGLSLSGCHPAKGSAMNPAGLGRGSTLCEQVLFAGKKITCV